MFALSCALVAGGLWLAMYREGWISLTAGLLIAFSGWFSIVFNGDVSRLMGL
jgi:hypothetical protein